MSSVSSIVDRLKNRDPLPSLSPKEIWDPELSTAIMVLSDQELTGQEEPSALSVQATRSGLLLWNDDLYASHTLSQDISQQIGSYWHGIMHRLEGDYSNANYWFRLVGHHPVFETLYQQAVSIWPELQQWGQWDAARFVDSVKQVVTANQEESATGQALRKIQALEYSLLLEYSLQV